MKINLKLTNQKALDLTGRTQYIDQEVVKSAPQHKDKEVKLEFFKTDKFTSVQELAEEYEKRGLRPADLRELCIYDKENTDYDYFATQWEIDGIFYFATFLRWDGRRSVGVSRHGGVWHDDWWFAGVCK